MNKTLLGILCLHICLLIGLSQSRQARMDSEWKSKRSIGARDGGQQKFPSPEVDPCPSGRDGGQQKFPSPDPCNRKKRSEQSGRDGGQQKFPSSEEKRSGIVSDTDPTSLQTGLGIEKKAELNPYNRMGNLQKRLNPHHRMAPNFDKKSDDDAIIIEEKRDNSNLFRPLPKEEEGTIVEVKRLNPHHRMAPDFGKRSAQAEWQTNKNPLFRPLNENTEDAIIAVGNEKRSAQAEWQTNTNPLFRPLNENTDDGANDEPNIVSVKRSAQADWQDLPDVFRPLNENTEEGTNEDAIIAVGNKRTSIDQIKQGLGNIYPQFRPLPETEKNTIVEVKRGENMNPFNRMAEVNPFNRMATPPSKRNNCASNSPSVEYDESMLTECCNVWFPDPTLRSGRVKDMIVFRACSDYLS